jgi:uroporphyrinogen decarboxylase
MTPREITRAAIERTGPPRLPITYCNRDFEFSDIVANGWAAAAGFVPPEPGMNEWGYVWHSLDETMGQPNVHPLADWDRISDYEAPDPFAPGRLDHLPAWCADNADRYTRFGVGISGFNLCTFLRGFEAFLMDLYTQPDRAGKVMDMVFGFENGLLDRLADYPVDNATFGDDWGTQQCLIVSPALWREVFKPRYADQFARAHRGGKTVWFHTCGNVYEIIGDLIEIGVDVLELLQPDVFAAGGLTGPQRLASDFGGSVCFCCSVDHQRRASHGSREEILAYARHLVETLGSYNGGFIGYVEDYRSLGMDEEHYQWIRQAFHGLQVTG